MHQVHLLNYENAKSLNLTFSHFVLMSSDAVFLRKGAEAWVRQHGMSFGLGMEGNREYNLDEYRRQIRARVLNSRTEKRVLHVNQSNREIGCYGGYIVDRMMRPPGFIRFRGYGFGLRENETDRCINFYQHEGTFYTVQIMDRYSKT